MIPINEFQTHIEAKILHRGQDYFEEGHVIDVQEISNNLYEAIVEGSDNYNVNIELEGAFIKDHSCDCPYEMGPICKHVVATVFYLVEVENVMEELEDKKQSKAKTMKKKPKKKTIKAQLQEALDNASLEELKVFIENRAAKDKQFRDYFLAAFAPLNTDEAKALYQKQIKKIVKKYSDRYGFVDWSDSQKLGMEVYTILTTAQEQLHQKNYPICFAIATATIDEMGRSSSMRMIVMAILVMCFILR